MQVALTVEYQAIPIKEDKMGVIRVGSTRVTLDTVVHAFQRGHTAEEIVSHYPALKLADVYAVISYYLNNQSQVQTYLQRQQVETEKVLAKIETNPDYQLFRERLLARHQANKSSTNK
jgi:uncharacterized protein (DUF433 family)